VLTPGQTIELSVEKAAAGGRMLGRVDGQVVLVAGAIPGERVAARIDRTERRLAFASVVEVKEPSPDRRSAFPDPTCGGCVYSHIAYPRQLALKADIVRDAFLRIGRITIAEAIDVAASPERGYRTRARLHVDGSRVGFFREGTHTLCDAAATGQLSDRASAAVRSVVSAAVAAGVSVSSVELSESIDERERALSLHVADVRAIDEETLAEVLRANGVKGAVVYDESGRSREVGDVWIVDSLKGLTLNRVASGELRHRPEAFFQANRYLVPALVTAVLDSVSLGGPVLDLYSGVGLFAVALAAAGHREITAVEGHPISGADLEANARQAALQVGAVTVDRDSVEGYLKQRSSRSQSPATLIVDPPRTGISGEAIERIVKLRAAWLVYVSCDPATMARDARRLLDGGYRLVSLRGFDLFPNTPHIESCAVFEVAG
jgi:23S rRNA (uracil-5-)-methyltransferase RumA